MRLLSLITSVVLLVICDAAVAAAQLASDQPETSVGVWFATAFWIVITILLLFGALLLTYHSAKRPNRR